MKPPPFIHHAPRDLGAALRTLAEVRGKVLAGGQSLIPMLNMRLAAPEHLVDINRVAGLDTVETTPAGVRVGALVRHSEAERAGLHPLLTRALKLVAHPVIRNRGTVVGSLVHADPAAELPAVLAVLGGHVRVARRDGNGGMAVRDVPAGEFFVGPMESDVRPDELAVSAFFPALGEGAGVAFEEVARRHGDYALAGVCAVVSPGEVVTAKVACIGVGPVPVVVELDAGETDWRAVAARVRDATEPEDDIHASAAYRRHLVGVLAERALRNAAREGAAARGA
ncbi:xanthine dehydrogenase family protein subunit M [Nonomuraea antimicrobica]|uniref:Xanthine dehydrogenase family protein subunit M n=1 Tax=Nonomuraea antimicrobica TaxID=561173 RepID=A0ABP7DNT2_9ACTN